MSYVPIRLRTIKPRIPVTFDVYIQLRDRFVLYVRNGDDIDFERLKNLKDKKVKKFYILSEDEEKYQQFLDDRLTQAMNDQDLDDSSKAQATSDVAATAVEDMQEDPSSQRTFKLLEKAAEGIIHVVGKSSDILDPFFQKVKNSDAPPTIKHALNVSSLVACMAEAMEYPEKKAQNMTVAALLMDVGIINYGEKQQELFTKNRKSFSPEDWKAFREHPIQSYKLLSGKDYINEDILHYVYTHEEVISGEGFPQGLTNLSPEQGIIGISACFDRHVTFMGKSYEEAFEEISVNQLGNFDLKLINTFKSLIRNQCLKLPS